MSWAGRLGKVQETHSSRKEEIADFMNESNLTLDRFHRLGYLEAKLDPLGRLVPERRPELDVPGAQALAARNIYCASIGVEFMHISSPDRRRFIQEQMESTAQEPDRSRIIDRLLRADLFEQILQSRYIGTKRYSLEGLTVLIPLLDEVLAGAARQGAQETILSMSHRGRLNVVVNVLGKRPRDIFAEFEDNDPRSVLGGGDVKYHLGATGEFRTPQGKGIQVHLVSNPSHLEAVTPVAMGRARAKQDRQGLQGPVRILPISLHGDAAFSGQGILAETLNLANLSGYTVGGTIHIILNNLIGFTTSPDALSSSRYCSDIALRLAVPILHVNGEDPDAVVRVARIALEYRYAFQSDVVIDLIGYRRHGHSEVDDPTTTQPVLYRKIAALPPLWKSYGSALGIDPDAGGTISRIREDFDREFDEAKALKATPRLYELPGYWSAYEGGPYLPARELNTGVSPERLRELSERINTLPREFKPHPKIARLLEERRRMGGGERPVDWGMAEALAFGSLLWEGARVRISGQDTRRGTFNQRHAVVVDHESGAEYVPLRHLHSRQGAFDAVDSPLAEASILGFEYGYSRDFPEALALWEAQFGDFANGGQVILDQFVSAGEDKWGLLSGLVLLLPHGYEGQGPEHSSARPERFLQLAAEDDFQVCQPSTAAQYFHLLRRQALRRWRKPLVVLTPKSLLRNPVASCPLQDFTQGRFERVIADPDTPAAERVLVASGKIGHELRLERSRRPDSATAILLVEELYPFPEKELAQALTPHQSAREIVWVQEEPANMGALAYILPRLRELAGDRPVLSVKRAASASPATGSPKAHALEQATLVSIAMGRRR
jgi:2-oxoglutarate dehydrogenase E1 component